jgi:hypothetical protein
VLVIVIHICHVHVRFFYHAIAPAAVEVGHASH